MAECFWTGFNKSYEVCGEEVVGEATWWPVPSTEFEYIMEETLILANAGDDVDTQGLTIFNTLSPPPFSVGAGGIGGALLYDPLSDMTHPDVLSFNTDPVAVTEAWNLAAYNFPYSAGAVLNVGADAASASISVSYISGPNRTLSLAGTDGNFAIFAIIDASNLETSELVYTTFEVTVNGQVLTLHCSHYTVGF